MITQEESCLLYTSLVEKLSMATFGSMPKVSAVLAVSMATSPSFCAAENVTSPVALSTVS